MNQSIYEDENNHFHVDWYIKNNTNKKSLETAIFGLKYLAENYENKGLKGVRFWLSFSTPDICKKFAIKNGLYEKGDKYYISDRLSFYKIRENEEIISRDNNCEGAIMIIDI